MKMHPTGFGKGASSMVADFKKQKYTKDSTQNKRLLLYSTLILIPVLFIASRLHPHYHLAVVKMMGLAKSRTSKTRGLLSGLFSSMLETHKINEESIKMLYDNWTWHGRPTLLARKTSNSHFWLDDDVAFMNKELSTGGMDMISLSKFSMDAYMENWEWDILQKPALTVAMDAGNETTSTMKLVNELSSYRVGDVITVRVDIRDGNGRQKKQGGDQVRVWMTDKLNKACQASDVTDMGNGSYISAIPLTWAGFITIKSSVAYNSEIQRAHFFIRNIVKSSRFMAAGFTTAFSSEATLCSPFPVIPQTELFCNFTIENGGMPWFCGKPRNPGLDCRHWKYNFDLPFISPLPLTRAEKTWTDWLAKFGYQRVISSNVQLQVELKTITRYQRSKPRCGDIPLKDSWTSTAPRGYFRHRVWHPVSCTLPVLSRSTLSDCLLNTTFLLLGDSNLRLAFQILLSKINCQLNRDSLKSKWHRPVYCFNETSNIAIYWNPHGLPFHLGIKEMYADRSNLKHASQYIDEVPSQGRFIILIHLYLHLTPHHYSVFTSHMTVLRKAVERLLQRNPDVKIILRGPHASSHFHEWYGIRAGDLAGIQYTDIIKREFKGLYDKVYFLQAWDMTVSIENVDFHPPNYVNQALMNLVLEYVCHNR